LSFTFVTIVLGVRTKDREDPEDLRRHLDEVGEHMDGGPGKEAVSGVS
jgi:hypothetical protein